MACSAPILDAACLDGFQKPRWFPCPTRRRLTSVLLGLAMLTSMTAVSIQANSKAVWLSNWLGNTALTFGWSSPALPKQYDSSRHDGCCPRRHRVERGKSARIVLSGPSLAVFVREATPIISDEGGFHQGAGKAKRSDCEPGRVASSKCPLVRMIGTRFSGLAVGKSKNSGRGPVEAPVSLNGHYPITGCYVKLKMIGT